MPKPCAQVRPAMPPPMIATRGWPMANERRGKSRPAVAAVPPASIWRRVGLSTSRIARTSSSGAPVVRDWSHDARASRSIAVKGERKDLRKGGVPFAQPTLSRNSTAEIHPCRRFVRPHRPDYRRFVRPRPAFRRIRGRSRRQGRRRRAPHRQARGAGERVWRKNAAAVAMDVEDEASVIAGFDAAEKALGPIDSVIANAGMNHRGMALDLAIADFDKIVSVNFRGVFLTAREAAKRMIAHGSKESRTRPHRAGQLARRGEGAARARDLLRHQGWRPDDGQGVRARMGQSGHQCELDLPGFHLDRTERRFPRERAGTEDDRRLPAPPHDAGRATSTARCCTCSPTPRAPSQAPRSYWTMDKDLSGAGAPSLRSKQLTGAACTIAALITLAIVWHWRQVFHVAGPASDDTPGRLAYVFTWLLLPGLSLLIGVQAAARRGFYRDAIDGTRTPSSPALEINLRYNTNTVEQVILAAIAWTGLALYLPARHASYDPGAGGGVLRRPHRLLHRLPDPPHRPRLRYGADRLADAHRLCLADVAAVGEFRVEQFLLSPIRADRHPSRLAPLAPQDDATAKVGPSP